MRYQFIAEYRHEYSITLMCRVLEVSVSGYYAWVKRPPSQHSREDAHLAEQVKTVFQANRRVSMPSCKHRGSRVRANEWRV